MKRKSYFSFLLPRLIASVLVVSVIFLILQTVLAGDYNRAIYNGIYNRREMFEKLVRNYDKDKYGAAFIDIYTNFYASDYFRFAEVKEDGSFEIITETDYKSIPVEDGARHWYYVTNDNELLAKGKRTTRLNDTDWTIEYKKCDEAREISNLTDLNIRNSWDIGAVSDFYGTDMLFTLALVYSGTRQYKEVVARSHYVEGDTLHLGKAAQVYNDMYMNEKEPLWGKKWDFTDPSKADRYITENSEEFDRVLLLFPQRVRPDAFLNDNNGMFLAGSMSDLQKAYDKQENEDVSFERLFKEFSEKKFVNGRYVYDVSRSTETTKINGQIDFYNINGKLYMIESVITTVSAGVFLKPFYILSAVLLLFAAALISCITAIRPYSQYKKAYENNIFKNNLIDSLAHNMKTPLQILGGYAENLKDVSSDAEKDRYAEQILVKTSEMNKDIEAILRTVEKTDRKFAKESVRSCIGEVAAKLGEDVQIKGDAQIKMDKEYFKSALYCLLDNAAKYKSKDSKIEVDITCNAVMIRNKTDKNNFTPGTGIAIAGRILEQHKLHLETMIGDGVFEARFGKHPGKQKKK